VTWPASSSKVRVTCTRRRIGRLYASSCAGNGESKAEFMALRALDPGAAAIAPAIVKSVLGLQPGRV
jgi:hypothetical protein